jgi:hypothetical protein
MKNPLINLIASVIILVISVHSNLNAATVIERFEDSLTIEKAIADGEWKILSQNSNDSLIKSEFGFLDSLPVKNVLANISYANTRVSGCTMENSMNFFAALYLFETKHPKFTKTFESYIEKHFSNLTVKYKKQIGNEGTVKTYQLIFDNKTDGKCGAWEAGNEKNQIAITYLRITNNNQIFYLITNALISITTISNVSSALFGIPLQKLVQ